MEKMIGKFFLGAIIAGMLVLAWSYADAGNETYGPVKQGIRFYIVDESKPMDILRLIQYINPTWEVYPAAEAPNEISEALSNACPAGQPFIGVARRMRVRSDGVSIPQIGPICQTPIPQAEMKVSVIAQLMLQRGWFYWHKSGSIHVFSRDRNGLTA